VAVVAAAAGAPRGSRRSGAPIVGLRLDTAGLPVESVVALMSAEHRFAIGAGYLIAPVFVGLVGFAVDWLVIKHWHDRVIHRPPPNAGTLTATNRCDPSQQRRRLKASRPITSRATRAPGRTR
jgi:hypothetical protein